MPRGLASSVQPLKSLRIANLYNNSMRTYNQTEADLAFQWVDKYFKLVELILEISGDDENDISPAEPSLESEHTYKRLREWFLARQDKFMPIWFEFWRDELSARYFEDNADGQQYLENPFLLLYKPDNLHQLAYRLGVTENIDTWESTEQGANMIEDIAVEFSLKVLQFIHFVGEFYETMRMTQDPWFIFF